MMPCSAWKAPSRLGSLSETLSSMSIGIFVLEQTSNSSGSTRRRVAVPFRVKTSSTRRETSPIAFREKSAGV